MHLFARNTIFLVLAGCGYIALWKFARDNGTFSLMREWSSQNRLPGTEETYITDFTRWRWLDEFLRSLLTLFWPMVNGTQPGSSLMCLYFAGQGITTWILTVLEGQRRVNKESGKLASYTTTYGLLFQGLGIGIVGPVFLAFTPIGDQSTGSAFVDSRSDVDFIIPATIGGVIVPTILMSLHAPTVVTLDQKIDLIRLWQFFPLLFRLVQRLWAGFIMVVPNSPKSKYAEQDMRVQRKALNRVYTFGLCCAAIPHVSTLFVSFTSLLFPRFFAANISAEFHPINLFVPVSPFSGKQATSVGEGAHWFLQWDMILMFCSYLVWAYFANLAVRDPSAGILSTQLVLRMLGWSLLCGPVGAALLATWERDDAVFKIKEQEIKSRNTSNVDSKEFERMRTQAVNVAQRNRRND